MTRKRNNVTRTPNTVIATEVSNDFANELIKLYEKCSDNKQIPTIALDCEGGLVLEATVLFKLRKKEA